MTEMFLHGRQISSVFQLLGDKENDITYSVGWALSRCGCFLKAVVADLFPKAKGETINTVWLQEYSRGSGRTDIEISGPTIKCIIEAKRGWNLPTEHQLRRYASRLRSGHLYKALVVMSESSPEYAGRYLPKSINGIDVLYRSWKKLETLASGKMSPVPHSEKRLLVELRTYLRSLMTMQNHTSNLVYVVSLAAGKATGSSL